MSRHLSRVAGLALVALVLAGAAWAQTITGRISGTVTDTSKGVLPGVTVAVTETRTGFTQNATTDADGVFVFVSLPLGDYTVSAELEGFKKAVKSGFVLGADERLSANFMLEVGSFSETVEVSVAAETVNQTSGEIARKVDQTQVQNLALNGRNYLQLTTLIPGVPLLNDSALDIMTGLGINTSINGSRQNANLLTVDGGFNMDSGSNNSQISNVGIDLIDEVSIKTASFSAEYGRNSGAAINVVTRSGTNRFRGSGFYYLRDESLDANEFFNNARNVEKPELSYDNYGGTVGGPIIRDKLFFFGGLEWRSIDRFTTPTLRTLPNSAMRGGNFSHLTTTLRDPATGLPFPGNIIPADRITADGRAVANVYAAMADAASSYTDTPTSNNALFQDANPFDFRQESLKVDYVPGIAQRFTLRMIFDHYKLIAPYGTFIDSQLPTIPTERNRPGQNVQVNHFWTLRSNLVNEAKFNYSGNGQKIPPVGDAWKRDTYGFQFTQLYADGGEYENSIPNVDVSGFATFRGANASLVSPTKDFSFSDTLTWVKGDHTLKAGGLVIRNQKDQNGRSEYAGFVNFATSGNTRTTGNAFADALLGNFRTYREAQLDPMGYYRFWQTEAFVSDQWRVSSDLSVEAGLRYYYYTPTYLLGNNATSFDPNRYSVAQAVTMNTNGTIVPGTGNRYNGLVRPGDVPSDQVDGVPNAGSPAVQSLPIADHRGFFPSGSLFAPRFSASWSPGGSATTAVRGGVGLFYDHSEGNLYFPLANNPPFSLSSEYQNGNLAAAGGGTAAPLAPWGTIDSLSPDLAWPRQWNYSVSVQQQLPWWNLFGEIAYVGANGQHLLRQPDINQPSFTDLSNNAPPGPNYSTNYLRPYKGYSSIRMRLTDADSEYNALQLNVGRRRGDLQFMFNYTYSKAYDNASGNTDDPEDYLNQDYNWGPSNHDRTHVIVVTWNYAFPWLRDSRSLAGYLLGGWQLSGITRSQSGAPLTITGSTSIGTRRADYLGGDVYYPDDERFSATGAPQWLRPEAFAAAPDGRRGNSERGAYRGPWLNVWDMTLRKQFPITGTVRGQVEIAAFNVWNHTNLRFSGQSLSRTTAGFGQLNQAAPPRQVQLGFRVTF